MYIYSFTNDLRIEILNRNLKSISKHMETGDWVHEEKTLEEAQHGLYPATELYFGLIKGSSNTNLILQGKELHVIKEFVKKFQYPYPRDTKKKGMQDFVDNDQCLAPLRIAVKLLYLRTLKNEGTNSTITIEEFTNYILTNPTIATGSEDIVGLDNYIELNPTPSHEIDFEYYGGGNNKIRFVRDLFNIAAKLPFLSYTSQKLTLDISNLNKNDKCMLGDILLCKDHWDYPEDYSDRDKYTQLDLENNYKEYLQVVPNFMSLDEIEIELGKSDELPTNIIYYGAPGTGKSYKVNELIKKEYPHYDDKMRSTGSEYVFRTTIHQDYSYYDFVGQLMPTSDFINDNEIRYEFNSGIFTNALMKAYETPEKKVFLILEEMSRGNITTIFGDIFQLLDRDIKTGISEFGITNKIIAKEVIRHYINSNDELSELEKNATIIKLTDDFINDYNIKLPGNLYIYGTLNTSDQNVFLMDSAFKRRFNFKYVSLEPVKNVHDIFENNFLFTNNSKTIEWISFYQGINQFIQDNSEVAEDKFIGQFFIIGKVSDTEADDYLVYNTNQIKDKLLNYLFNDVEKHIRISNSELSIFSNKKASFSKIYSDFDKGINIFSKELLDKVQLTFPNTGSDLSDEQ